MRRWLLCHRRRGGHHWCVNVGAERGSDSGGSSLYIGPCIVALRGLGADLHLHTCSRARVRLILSPLPLRLLRASARALSTGKCSTSLHL